MVISKVTVSIILSAALMAFAVSANAASPLAFCKADAARLCPGVEPGQGRLVKCMKEHKDEVSIGCAKELKKLKG